MRRETGRNRWKVKATGGCATLRGRAKSVPNGRNIGGSNALSAAVEAVGLPHHRPKHTRTTAPTTRNGGARSRGGPASRSAPSDGRAQRTAAGRWSSGPRPPCNARAAHRAHSIAHAPPMARPMRGWLVEMHVRDTPGANCGDLDRRKHGAKEIDPKRSRWSKQTHLAHRAQV